MLVPGSLNVLPVARDDMYGAIGNTERMVVNRAFGLLSNDLEFESQGLSVASFDDTLTAGEDARSWGEGHRKRKLRFRYVR